jgi:peptidoglycan/LPS O-acetylase OafA/YrhL
LKARIFQVDIMRSIAVMLVVFFHFNLQTSYIPFWNYVTMSGGPLGVNIFFVISGFLISYPFFKSGFLGSAPPSVRVYIINRLLRIIPLFWATSIFLFIIKDHIHTYTYSNYLLNTRDLVKNIFFLSENLMILNPVIWTLRIEILFYILFPIAWFLFLNRLRFNLSHIYLTVGLTLMLFLGYRIFQFYQTANFRGDIISCFEGFILGMYIAMLQLYDRGNIKFKNRFPITLPIFIIILAATLNQTVFLNKDAYYPFFTSLSNAGIFLLFIGILDNNYQVRINWLSSALIKSITFISLISYSIYLVHFNVYYDIALPFISNGVQLTGSMLLISRLVALALTFAISYLTYSFIEKPFLSLKIKKEKTGTSQKSPSELKISTNSNLVEKDL